MGAFLIIVAIIVVLYFVFRNKDKAPQSNIPSNSTRASKDSADSQPRDYLLEVEDFIGAPAPVNQLLQTNRAEVIHNLLNALNQDADIRHETGMPMSPTIRKAAVYALGQIGDPSTVGALTNRLNVEQASGVRDAIVASISAINLAPDPEHTQLERRKIIEEVYKGNRPPVVGRATQMGSSPTVMQQKARASGLASKVISAALAGARAGDLLPMVDEVLQLDPECNRSDFLLAAAGAFADFAMEQTATKHSEAASKAAKRAIHLGTNHLKTDRTGNPDILYSTYRALAIGYFCEDEYAQARDFCSRALQIVPDSQQMLMIQSYLAKG